MRRNTRLLGSVFALALLGGCGTEAVDTTVRIQNGQPDSADTALNDYRHARLVDVRFLEASWRELTPGQTSSEAVVTPGAGYVYALQLEGTAGTDLDIVRSRAEHTVVEGADLLIDLTLIRPCELTELEYDQICQSHYAERNDIRPWIDRSCFSYTIE